MSKLRFHYARARGDTITAMRNAVHQTSLPNRGDTILIWINEGDLYSLMTTHFLIEEEHRRPLAHEAQMAMDAG